MGGFNITSEFVIFLLLIIGAIAGAWWRIEGVVKGVKRDIQDTLQISINAAATKADTAAGLYTLLSNQLMEHKLHVAEQYIRRDGIKELRDQLMSSIGDVKTTMNTISERMDRMVQMELERGIGDKK